MKKRVSLVTGASSGLGRDIAKLLCKKEYIVYVVARRREKLLELQKECKKEKGEIKIIAGDLTKEDFRKRLIKKVLEKEKKIDYLINNAGYGKLTNFENIEFKDIKGMFELNAIAGEHLTQLVLPSMKKHKKGRIVNVASVVALEPPVYFSTYNATKYAVYGFSKTLSYELKRTGVSISVAFPSRMKTGFWDVAFKCKGLNGKAQKTCIEKWTKKTKGSMPVAKYIVRNINSHRLILLPDMRSKLAYHLFRHFHFIGKFYMKNIMLPQTKKVLFHTQK